MKRWPVGAALVVALLGQVRADAQNRFGDPSYSWVPERRSACASAT